MSPNAPSMTLAVPLEPTDHMQGSEHARVTVVEYGDFECPSCKVAATDAEAAVGAVSRAGFVSCSDIFRCRRPIRTP